MNATNQECKTHSCTPLMNMLIHVAHRGQGFSTFYWHLFAPAGTRTPCTFLSLLLPWGVPQLCNFELTGGLVHRINCSTKFQHFCPWGPNQHFWANSQGMGGTCFPRMKDIKTVTFQRRILWGLLTKSEFKLKNSSCHPQQPNIKSKAHPVPA